jgi:DnaJ-class molecular chaperone
MLDSNTKTCEDTGMQKCDKCSGTGRYRQFGVCFQCKGTGKEIARKGLTVDNTFRAVKVARDCAEVGHDLKPCGQYRRCACGVIA